MADLLRRPFTYLRSKRQVMSAEQRDAVEGFLFERARLGGPTTRNFVVLSVLSSMIASMGLLLDSAPAVIGAMLLGPFITPLLAIAGSLIQGWGTRFARAVSVVGLGVVVSLCSGGLVSLIFARQLDHSTLPTQLLALTRPGLLDLGIALAAGVAAGYATMRTEAAGALSGVAVSVTLEPPLAAMGLFLASRDGDDFRQAALAFATNFGALVFGATLAMAWWGFGNRATRGTRSQTGIGLVLWVVTLLAIAVPLAVYSEQVVVNSAFEDEVIRVIGDWDPSVSVVRLDASVTGDRATVRVDLSGPRDPEPAWKLAEMLSERRHARVSVEIRFTLTTEERAVSSG
ncbi:MAG: hypothetical protein RLZZ623_1078 [Actinomycetota bacterium]